MSLDKSELLAELAMRGSAATSKRLDRWRGEGVLPTPQLIHERGRAGSRSVYPRRAIDQVLAIESALAERRSFDFVAARLWWNGYSVDPERLRMTLDTQFASLLAKFDGAGAAGGDTLDVAERLVATAELEGRGPSERRANRRGVRGEDRRTLMIAAFQLLLGGEPAWDVADLGSHTTVAALAERFSGVERAKADPIVDGSPWLPQAEQIPALIESLLPTGRPHYRELLTRVGRSTEQELNQARDLMVWLGEVVRPVVAGVEASFGPDAGGIGDLPLLFSPISTADYALAVLIGLSFNFRLEEPAVPPERVAQKVLGALGLPPLSA